MYQRILVALDGSEEAEHVLPHVEALAEKFGSEIILFRATTPTGLLIAEATAMPDAGVLVDPEPILEADRSEATSYLTNLAERLRGKGVEVHADVAEGATWQAIVDEATRLSVDLIAMTTHGREGLSRLFHQSVADRVLHHSPCPVLCARIPDRKRQK